MVSSPAHAFANNFQENQEQGADQSGSGMSGPASGASSPGNGIDQATQVTADMLAKPPGQQRFATHSALPNGDFKLGGIINFPIFEMGMDAEAKHIMSEFGEINGKCRYGLILHKSPKHMAVLVFGTSGGKGPDNQPEAKRRNCVGVTQEGTPFSHRLPNSWVLKIPKHSKYQSIPGVYFDLTFVVMVPYDSRVVQYDVLAFADFQWLLDLYYDKMLDAAGSNMGMTIYRSPLGRNLEKAQAQIEEQQPREQQQSRRVNESRNHQVCYFLLRISSLPSLIDLRNSMLLICLLH